MADISRGEMGLIIGLVLGTLFLTLIAVLAYIAYDKQRDEKRASRRFPTASESRARLPPPAGGHAWTTINNSMVGLEVCETSSNTSGRGPDTLGSSQRQGGGGEGAALAPGGGAGAGAGAGKGTKSDGGAGGGGGGTRKSLFLAAMVNWALSRPRPPSLPPPNSDRFLDEEVIVAAAVASSATAAPPSLSPESHAGANQATSPKPPVAAPSSTSSFSSLSSSLSSSSGSSLPFSWGSVSGSEVETEAEAEAGLAMVLVQLGAPGAADEGPNANGAELPFGGCLGDAVVSLQLGPPMDSPAPSLPGAGKRASDTSSSCFMDLELAATHGSQKASPLRVSGASASAAAAVLKAATAARGEGRRGPITARRSPLSPTWV